MFADLHIRDGGGFEMIDLANFGKADSDDVWLHGQDYTVTARRIFVSVQPARDGLKSGQNFIIWSWHVGTKQGVDQAVL
jgi:hypothetical protein